ncbi:uncharacterized protein (DUF2336 family) [Rhizobium halophytocola]|uniref:Uncharacterized protein (DUF2336 family) n=2 Tax=Rhizobium halophytocola TaxID=735519 RepID=A0ABS4E5P9_9HYPH|nr:DUF2336 domain-containing protein [Rhizobium halophytocola]MBP1853272.1 uncharacterized protein (DUF2336 family) [Rhizobium halophytocola]
MATVTGFESLTQPSKSELRQFAELFAPLFAASSDEARRQAVAALSQSDQVPTAVALFIASQPIAVAAPFLAASPCLSDDLLITVARTQGLDHARAIVKRDRLSPRVIDALVDLRHEIRMPRSLETTAASTRATAADEAERRAREAERTERRAREEKVRRTIKTLAGHGGAPGRRDRTGLRTITPMQEALMVRFARNRETGAFATALADALSSSRWLAERIMLDISGRQLATTLVAIAMQVGDILDVLGTLYPQLNERQGSDTRAEKILATLDPAECEERIEAWYRADSYTYTPLPVAHPITGQSASPGDGRDRPALRHRSA